MPVIFIMLAGLLMIGCSTQSEVAQAPATAVSQSEPESAATDEPQAAVTELVTEEVVVALVTEEAEAAFVTEEVVMTPEPMATDIVATEEVQAPSASVRYQNEDGTLFVVTTSVLNRESMPNLPDAPDGQQYIVLNATLANLTGEPLIVDGTSLTLIDTRGNRYPVFSPEDFLRTTLPGSEMNGSGTLRGVVRFQIPADATPQLLEWCPYNDCARETLQTLMP